MKLKFENLEIAHIAPMSLSNIPRMNHLRLAPAICSICDPISFFVTAQLFICNVKIKRILVQLFLGQSFYERRSNLSMLFRMKLNLNTKKKIDIQFFLSILRMACVPSIVFNAICFLSMGSNIYFSFERRRYTALNDNSLWNTIESNYRQWQNE